MFDSNTHPEDAKPFWDAVIKGQFRIVLSDVLFQEIEQAPQHVRDFLETLPESQIEQIVSTNASDDLAERYILGGIVGESSLADCQHVALATIAQVDVLVSWNLKHLVKRQDGYKMINRVLDYPEISIQNPKDLMENDHDNT
jgi:DNA-binding transcriptional LysR family regulator